MLLAAKFLYILLTVLSPSICRTSSFSTGKLHEGECALLLGSKRRFDQLAQYSSHPFFMPSQGLHQVQANEGNHYNDAIMGTISSQITSLTIVYSTVYSDVDQRKHQSSASLAFVWGIHRRPVNSPHKWPVTRKMFPFDDVIMITYVAFPLTGPRCWYATKWQCKSMHKHSRWCKSNRTWR